MGIPKFGLFINLVGAFSCTALVFVLPIRIYDKVFANEINTRRKLMHKFLMAFGLIVGAISVVASIKELTKAFMIEHHREEEIIDISENEVFRLDLNPPPLVV